MVGSQVDKTFINDIVTKVIVSSPKLDITEKPLNVNPHEKPAGLSTIDNLAAIHNQIDGQDSIIIFLDLRKAFELANRQVIISLLASKGISGKLLSWSNDYLYNRQARVKYQGPSLNFIFLQMELLKVESNILVAKVISLDLPSDTHLVRTSN